MRGTGGHRTRQRSALFVAGARIAQHFGRPGTPTRPSLVESFFGHLKSEFPHLDKMTLLTQVIQPDFLI